MAGGDNSRLDELDACIASSMIADQLRFRRWLRDLRGGRRRRSTPNIAQLEEAVLASMARREQRAAARPALHYPPELPISGQRDVLLSTIRAHPVTVVCGETGSGKTTQLPKLCIELGRGVGGMIGHTQPRRIAARTVAQRIAREVGSSLGGAVGFKVRFDHEVGPESLVKVMTDGILLAEIRTDRDLRAYDTLIIDEAHERSLNIDFLLGYVKQLLTRRSDLKVIVTSATLDPERIAEHFGGAPIVSVSGRAYPVEVRYRPVAEEDTLTGAVRAAVHEAVAHGPGDLLVFLAGEREIREAQDLITGDPDLDVDVLMLHARLNTIRQAKVFEPNRGKRRVVLATNVAETSVTVPGIRFVVDTGRARISRFSYRTKVQRLPVEPVSQASAAQRAGRCGRIAPGVCIRLYEEADFLEREAFTVPEIQRTNLASVILQMNAAGLGRVQDFPFVDSPDHRFVREGHRLLQDLGALDAGGKLTAIGRRLARLPVDPQLGRMILAADTHDCVAEVLVIVAALGAGDPRERSLDTREAAASVHEAFVDQRSDFMTLLNLWSFYQEHAETLSRSQLRRFLEAHYLSPGRMREWTEVHRQLRILARSLGIRPGPEPATYGRIHKALLAGLFGFVGKAKQGREYEAARGSGFVLSRGSRVSPRSARWLVAAELVETTGLYAHTAARVRPEWIERAAGPRIRRTYLDVHWDVQRGEVMAYERVTLDALTLIPRRRVRYEPLEPEEARQQFIWSALVGGEMETPFAFRIKNDQLAQRLRRIEHKIRRLGLVVDDSQVFSFYDRRVPNHVASRRAFERWARSAPEAADQLCMSLEDLLREGSSDLIEGIDRAFPDDLDVGGLPLRLSYLFEPTSEADGITAHVPLPVLHQLSANDFEWTVPGLRREKVIALIRTLPKGLRRRLVPVPDVADRLLDQLDPQRGGLLDALEHALGEHYAIEIPREAWQLDKLPGHLAMSVAVSQGETIVERGRDFDSLRFKYAQEAEESFRVMARASFERSGLSDWTFGPLESHVDTEFHGMQVRGYPGLEDQGQSVRLRLFETEARAERATRFGLRRLFQLRVEREARRTLDAMPSLDALCLNYFFVAETASLSLGGIGIRAGAERGEELKRTVIESVVEATFLERPPARWDAECFSDLLAQGRPALAANLGATCAHLETILAAYREVRAAREARTHPDFACALADIDQQLDRLVFRGFVAATPNRALAEIPRYLEAVRMRLQKLPSAHARDERMLRAIEPICAQFWETYQHAGSERVDAAAARDEFRWMLEELRVAAFAEELGTPYPVSVRRCEDVWNARLPESVVARHARSG